MIWVKRWFIMMAVGGTLFLGLTTGAMASVDPVPSRSVVSPPLVVIRHYHPHYYYRPHRPHRHSHPYRYYRPHRHYRYHPYRDYRPYYPYYGWPPYGHRW